MTQLLITLTVTFLFNASIAAQPDIESKDIEWPSVLFDIDELTKHKKFDKALELVIRAYSDAEIFWFPERTKLLRKRWDYLTEATAQQLLLRAQEQFQKGNKQLGEQLLQDVIDIFEDTKAARNARYLQQQIVIQKRI